MPELNVSITAYPAPKWLTTDFLAHLLKGQEDRWEEISIVCVDCPAMSFYNEKYRNVIGPTDVLSFAFEPEEPLFGGQIILYHGAIDTYAQKAGLPSDLRWAHLLVHGLCHLQRLDHQTAEQAAQMHQQESEYWQKVIEQLPELKYWSFSEDYDYFYQDILKHKSASILG